MNYRIEKDLIGTAEIPTDAYWGVHTFRAINNFPLSGYKIDQDFITAFGYVKKAACLVNQELGFISEPKAKAITDACQEMINGNLNKYIVVDPLSGGAGTSLNMNVNEVIANRALELLDNNKGDYKVISPLEDVNLHQSTNDVYPTALKIACLFKLKKLEDRITKLQSAFQEKEKEFSDIVKIGRTELQEAVPMTLGAEFGGFAECFSQDRWRVFKARERLRLVNMGGTAIGTGLTAPQEYIFKIVEKLRELTGLNLARAENMIYVTQNLDGFCEASGILKTFAVDLVKISGDLRLLNLLGEIRLPAVQAGSSIMPGKVNPVVLEAVAQVGIKVVANDAVVTDVCSRGSLQINEFLPVLAFSFLESLDLLNSAAGIFAGHLPEIKADPQKCRCYLDSSPVIITAFLPVIGYEKAQDLVKEFADSKGKNIREFLETKLGKDIVDKVLSSQNLTKLGFTKP